MKDYPKTPISRIRRNPKRAVYDRETVHAILDSALLCHVAYVIDGQPYCTPTIHWREGETVLVLANDQVLCKKLAAAMVELGVIG